MNTAILRQLLTIFNRNSLSWYSNGANNHLAKAQCVLTTGLINDKRCAVLEKKGFASKATSTTTRTSTPVKKPYTFGYSGDLTTQKAIDLHQFKCGFKELPELKQSPLKVQRLCSIEFADGKEIKEYRLEEMEQRIEKLFGKDCIYESIVSRLTVDIRNMMPHCLNFTRDKRSKAILVEKIQRRKKMLKYLRRQDYEHFQWLLRELRIKYVQPPAYYGRVTRRFRRKQEVVLYAINLRREKMKSLQDQLEQERVEFEEYKKTTLAQIDKDIKELNLDWDAIKKTLEKKVEKEEIIFPHGWTPNK